MPIGYLKTIIDPTGIDTKLTKTFINYYLQQISYKQNPGTTRDDIYSQLYFQMMFGNFDNTTGEPIKLNVNKLLEK
jgi:hypothetical protein